MKKQIVFLEPYPTIMVHKLAKIFKEKGYETISIRILESKEPFINFYDSSYDKIIHFDASFFRIKIKNSIPLFIETLKKIKKILSALFEIMKLKPYVVLCRGQPNWPCALTIKICKKTPIIYFPYDIRSETYSSIKLAKKAGLKNFEINAEKFCFENADGIMHKGAPEELKFLDGRIFEKIDIVKNQISFLPYCAKEYHVKLNKNKLSKIDKEIHVIQASSVGSVNFNESSFLFDYLIGLAREKIHIHQYTHPNTLTKEEIMENFTRAYGDKIDVKYFHFHEPLNPKELVKEISKYDFGIFVPGPPPKKGEFHLEAAMGSGNKLASYIEAGIPFLYPSELKFIDRIAKKYKIGFCINDTKDIKKLNKIKYAQIEKNIEKAREDLDMDKNFPRLEKFIQEIVKKS